MNQVISWLHSVVVRVIFITVIVGFALLMNVALGFGNPLQAQAMPLLTVDTSSYRVDPDDRQQRPTNTKTELNNNPDLIENSREKLKDTADNLRDKLNPDEPLPDSTQKFVNKFQEKAKQVTQGK